MFQVVYVIDDEVAICRALTKILDDVGHVVECFATAEEFLAVCERNFRGCIITDVNMPGMSGLLLQDELKRRGVSLPIIFMTGYGRVESAVQAMKKGAVDFLEKPVSPEQLIERVEQALAYDRRQHQLATAARKLNERIAYLTPREKEVIKLVAEGRTNKEAAKALGISFRTVEKYRAGAMAKLKISSAMELSEAAKLLIDSVTE
ncbi:hypothetical protein Tel_13145 [Candidatus Tenderia electrophaga]|jgi:RNA polymerase sigma factor (sigma-70 family)|uniref:LuxR family transcriptional regulator n=1 Tax=Candidatus Tenderia electrophaga TaxID=1748243 RepID=A0A0S2TFR3_9GAMM|nr:hypothetical protein Tel_13145 [Candidatus Tenderia electrophaga]